MDTESEGKDNIEQGNNNDLNNKKVDSDSDNSESGNDELQGSNEQNENKDKERIVIDSGQKENDNLVKSVKEDKSINWVLIAVGCLIIVIIVVIIILYRKRKEE